MARGGYRTGGKWRRNGIKTYAQRAVRAGVRTSLVAAYRWRDIAISASTTLVVTAQHRRAAAIFANWRSSKAADLNLCWQCRRPCLVVALSRHEWLRALRETTDLVEKHQTSAS